MRTLKKDSSFIVVGRLDSELPVCIIAGRSRYVEMSTNNKRGRRMVFEDSR